VAALPRRAPRASPAEIQARAVAEVAVVTERLVGTALLEQGQNGALPLHDSPRMSFAAWRVRKPQATPVLPRCHAQRRARGGIVRSSGSHQSRRHRDPQN
jgi:hypothetical protein